MCTRGRRRWLGAPWPPLTGAARPARPRSGGELPGALGVDLHFLHARIVPGIATAGRADDRERQKLLTTCGQNQKRPGAERNEAVVRWVGSPGERG